MQVVLCDDEKYWAEAIKASVHQWADKRNVSIECTSFSAPKKLIKYITVNQNVDVLFLDITFGKEVIDGIGTAKHLRKMGNQIPIIFVTVDSFRAADGYLVEAMGFLAKPIDQNRLNLFLDRVLKKHHNDKIIKIETEKSVTNIRQKDILYVEVDNHTITYHTTGNAIKTRGTFGEVIDRLGSEHFVQIHRSYIISKNKIHSIKTKYPYSVNITGGAEVINLPVSRNHIKKLIEIYSDDVLEKMI